MSVLREQRFTPDHPCPICGGHDRMARGRGKRCHGYLSSDGCFARCTREEHAGSLPLEPDSGTYAHRLYSPCACGTTHGSPRASSPRGARKPKRLREQDFARCVRPYPCDYRDEQGNVLYRVARWRNTDGSKRYSQHHRAQTGLWDSNRGDAPRVLYRLPEVREAIARGETIYVCEGEKKVAMLVALGLCATTNDEGAGKWLLEHTAGLRGAQRVVVFSDNDALGRSHAQAVACELHAAGVPDVRVVIPPVGEGQGLDDWLSAQRRTRADVEALVAQSQLWEPAPQPSFHRPRGGEMPSGPFAKIYRSLWDGTLGHERSAREVFICMLTHCDAKGVIEMTHEAIAARCRVPLKEVRRGVEVLEGPDPRSRSREEEGRRIVRLDERRDWGWRIVNYLKYRESTGAQRTSTYRERHPDEVLARDRDRKRRVRDTVRDASATPPLPGEKGEGRDSPEGKLESPMETRGDDNQASSPCADGDSEGRP